jgi:hypothetical protein
MKISAKFGPAAMWAMAGKRADADTMPVIVS